MATTLNFGLVVEIKSMHNDIRTFCCKLLMHTAVQCPTSPTSTNVQKICTEKTFFFFFNRFIMHWTQPNPTLSLVIVFCFCFQHYIWLLLFFSHSSRLLDRVGKNYKAHQLRNFDFSVIILR